MKNILLFLAFLFLGKWMEEDKYIWICYAYEQMSYFHHIIVSNMFNALAWIVRKI